MQTAIFFTTALLLLIQLHSITAVDLENAKESSCFPIKKTVSVDESFLAAHNTWYYPLMSRFDVYWTGIYVSGKTAADLHEDELYYDGCFSSRFDEKGNYHITGFHGKQRVFQLKPVEGSSSQIYSAYTSGGKLLGTMYSTLTDNKSFYVMVGCTEENEMTWGVISPLKELPANTVKLIHEHVLSLGFNRDYFTGIRYEQCEKKHSKTKVSVDTPNTISISSDDDETDMK